MNCNKENHWGNVIIYGECGGSCGLTKGFIEAERMADGDSRDDKYANISADNEEIYDKELLAVDQVGGN